MAAAQQAKMADGLKIADCVNMLVSVIRENIVLRRVGRVAVEHGVVGTYVHNAVRPGLGQIAALVALRVSPSVTMSADVTVGLHTLANKLAMHAAGLKPVLALICSCTYAYG